MNAQDTRIHKDGKHSMNLYEYQLEYTTHTGLDIYRLSSAATAGVGDLSAISHWCEKADETGPAMANPPGMLCDMERPTPREGVGKRRF